MKIILKVVLLVTLSMFYSSFASSYFMKIINSDATSHVVSITDTTKITFTQTNMLINNFAPPIIMSDIAVVLFLDSAGVAIEDGTKKSNLLSFSAAPNPFNPIINFKFALLKKSDVDITVVSINGKVVRKLLNKRMKQGVYNISWNGFSDNNKKVSSGTYIVKLEVGNKIFYKRAILLK